MTKPGAVVYIGRAKAAGHLLHEVVLLVVAAGGGQKSQALRAVFLDISGEPCSQCGACVQVCREDAISLEDGGPVLDLSRCLSCGQCITSCPTGTLQEKEKGYRILVGGKLGRHPKLAEELPGIYNREEALRMVNRCLDFYQKHCTRGERLGEILEKTGIREIIDG